MDSGYWGDHTGSRDWCEPNYAVVPFIAEFYNTTSNILYIIFAINIYLNKRKLGALPQLDSIKSLNIMIGGMLILGVSSGTFHATLKYWPQFFDRIFCIVPLIGFQVGFDEFQDGFSMFSLCSYIMSSAIMMFLVFEIYCVYLACHGLYRGYHLSIEHEFPEIRQRGQRIFVWLLMAIVVWALDLLTCDAFLSRFQIIPHFHAMWHVLTAMSFHETALIHIWLFLKKTKQNPQFTSFYMISAGVDCDIKEIAV